uniref:RING-type domain-containing protein n=1 Tax=Amphimedon queenslandica TaxID=400682 RepID=A0A1X7UIT4_AMPQE
MAQFSKEELSFVEELPNDLKCPVCLNILTDPHLVSCCGHNFCGSCIERVKASNGSCPMCKEEEYQSFVDKKCLRIINGLEVYCSNKEKGCQWKGELKNMSTHLNKEKREGECQYEEAKCRYEKCQERKQRRYLKDHEDKECPQRLFQCQYCGEEGTFLSITKDHYEECRQYPVTCPNKCSSTNMPRGSLTAHINECPLEPVDCVFSWAGCNDKPLRKDVHVHTADTKHMTLLAVACGQLKKENEEMKKENEEMKKEIRENNDKIKKEMRQIRYAIPDYPLLPIKIARKNEPVHFYTGVGEHGVHMSAIVKGGNKKFTTEDVFLLLAFHEGKFEKYEPKIPKIIADDGFAKIPLMEDVKAPYKYLPHDILKNISDCDDNTDLEEGVIKIKVGTFSRGPNPAGIRFQRVTIKISFEL